MAKRGDEAVRGTARMAPGTASPLGWLRADTAILPRRPAARVGANRTGPADHRLGMARRLLPGCRRPKDRNAPQPAPPGTQLPGLRLEPATPHRQDAIVLSAGPGGSRADCPAPAWPAGS